MQEAQDPAEDIRVEGLADMEVVDTKEGDTGVAEVTVEDTPDILVDILGDIGVVGIMVEDIPDTMGDIEAAVDITADTEAADIMVDIKAPGTTVGTAVDTMADTRVVDTTVDTTVDTMADTVITEGLESSFLHFMGMDTTILDIMRTRVTITPITLIILLYRLRSTPNQSSSNPIIGTIARTRKGITHTSRAARVVGCRWSQEQPLTSKL